MQAKESNKILKKANIPIESVEKREETAALEINSWQPKVFTVEKWWQNCWLIHSNAEVYVCNN